MDQIGRYEVRRSLGQGGMATVYLAYDPRIRRQVAIKVLPRQFTHDPKYLARFEQEGQMIAKLEHPAIVPVHDFGEQDDAPYLVMRYMSGGSLHERIRGGKHSLTESAAIISRLASALDYAHEMGIIHRDLKPSNILFDDAGNPYLADFGIARLAEASKTVTLVGTPAYMSPEQVVGKTSLDGRSDIYALGVVLFEMLTGKQPYESETPTGQMFAHVNEPIPDIRALDPALPTEVQAVIEKAMAKDREARYAAAADLAADLSALASAGQLVGDQTPAPSALKPTESDTAAEPTASADPVDKVLGLAEDETVQPVPPGRSEGEIGTLSQAAGAMVVGAAQSESLPLETGRRSWLDTVLIILAGIAGILALIDAGRYAGLIDYYGNLFRFDHLDSLGPPWILALSTAVIGAIWFAAAFRLWAGAAGAVPTLRLLAIINIVLLSMAKLAGNDFADIGWELFVSGAILLLSFIDRVVPALRPEPLAKKTGEVNAPLPSIDHITGLVTGGQAPWWLATIEAGLLVLIGLFVLVDDFANYQHLSWPLTLYWFVSGTFNLIKLYFDRSLPAWKIASGICGLIAGIFLLQTSRWDYFNSNQITILTFLGIIIGTANLVQAVKRRDLATGILGALSITFALLLFADWNDKFYLLTMGSLSFLAIGGGILAILLSIQSRRA